MEELSVGSGSNFINDGWFKIKEDGSWDMLSCTNCDWREAILEPAPDQTSELTPVGD